MEFDDKRFANSQVESATNLRILEANARVAELNARKELLRARKELVDDGIDISEIDQLLPLQ